MVILPCGLHVARVSLPWPVACVFAAVDGTRLLVVDETADAGEVLDAVVRHGGGG